MCTEKQLQVLNKLSGIEKKARKEKAEIILEFIDSGGYVIAGYDSFKSFYCDHDLPFSKDYYYTILKEVEEALILGIPLGTYVCRELKGIKNNYTSCPSYNRFTGELISGTALILDRIEEYRNNWKLIQDYTRKELPSPKEIEEASADLFGKSYAGTGRSYYQNRLVEKDQAIADLTQENQQLKAEIQELKAEIQELKRQLNKLTRKLNPTVLSRG